MGELPQQFVWSQIDICGTQERAIAGEIASLEKDSN